MHTQTPTSVYTDGDQGANGRYEIIDFSVMAYYLLNIRSKNIHTYIHINIKNALLRVQGKLIVVKCQYTNILLVFLTHNSDNLKVY